MIHVIASIYIKNGKLDEIKAIYKAFVPEVESESGCILYCPTYDFPTDISTQIKDRTVITVIEKWASSQAFHAHLTAPHVIQFREDIKGIVEKVSIKVLENLL